SSRGFSPHEIMPPHCVLQSLVERCQALTREWHGRANCSYIFEMFMRMAERDGQSHYLFRDIPQQRSTDGFVRVLDAEARARLYSRAKPASSPSLALVGRMKQLSGESPIDNLQLPNLMRRQDALLLTVGRRVQQFFLQMLRWKQRRILRRWFPSEHEEYVVKEGAAKLQRSEEWLGTSLALAFLAEHGRLIESYGQVPEDVRIRADEFIAETPWTSLQGRNCFGTHFVLRRMDVVARTTGWSTSSCS
ncbi:U-box domain-containing protein, partial [Durusdinium trenchii]